MYKKISGRVLMCSCALTWPMSLCQCPLCSQRLSPRRLWRQLCLWRWDWSSWLLLRVLPGVVTGSKTARLLCSKQSMVTPRTTSQIGASRGVSRDYAQRLSPHGVRHILHSHVLQTGSLTCLKICWVGFDSFAIIYSNILILLCADS